MTLALVGVWGLVAYTASRRVHEIGIRKALGAHPRHILTLLLQPGAQLAVIGLAIGLTLGAGASRMFAAGGLLLGVSPLDPITYAAVAVAILAVILPACDLPARLALRTDPMVALRRE